MTWTVVVKTSVIDDLRWFGRKDGRLILKKAEEMLAADPTAETRNMKTLRPNPFAQRELKLLGKYRVLFNLHHDDREVTLLVAGEKRGSRLIVRGEVFEEHEDHTTQ